MVLAYCYCLLMTRLTCLEAMISRLGFDNIPSMDKSPCEHNQINMTSKSDADKVFANKLLDWYDIHARELPWRIPPKQSAAGIKPDPYQIWLSEVMLQQTQVATVQDYYLKFLQNWPTVQALAGAETEDVMKAWAGLGYYSRARNLKKCAEQVVAEFDGTFPIEIDELKKLPGIGDYTSAAISAIAFGKAVPVVDGNIERVMTRRHRIASPVRDAKSQIKQLVGDVLSTTRPGDFAQAMMDLGATICTPKNPACSRCPVNHGCLAYCEGDMEAFPVKAPKQIKPTRKGSAFVIQNLKGEVFLRKRAEKGLLGGMSEIPGTIWTARKDGETGRSALPFESNWQECGIAKHTFTHFHLELEVWQTKIAEHDLGYGWWVALAELSAEALPTVMKKAIAAALPDAFKG